MVWGISKLTSLNIIWVNKNYINVYNLLKVSQLFVVLFINYCCQRINKNENLYLIKFITIFNLKILFWWFENMGFFFVEDLSIQVKEYYSIALKILLLSKNCKSMNGLLVCTPQARSKETVLMWFRTLTNLLLFTSSFNYMCLRLVQVHLVKPTHSLLCS